MRSSTAGLSIRSATHRCRRAHVAGWQTSDRHRSGAAHSDPYGRPTNSRHRGGFRSQTEDAHWRLFAAMMRRFRCKLHPLHPQRLRPDRRIPPVDGGLASKYRRLNSTIMSMHTTSWRGSTKSSLSGGESRKYMLHHSHCRPCTASAPLLRVYKPSLNRSGVTLQVLYPRTLDSPRERRADSSGVRRSDASARCGAIRVRTQPVPGPRRALSHPAYAGDGRERGSAAREAHHRQGRGDQQRPLRR